MADKIQAKSKNFSIDWLVKGTLTKVGDILDRLTGRGWKPSSSLATSGLIERMKSLMDAEARQDEHGRRYVPHNIRLKMQWDKFSTDSDESLQKLENELLVAAVDYINDRRYYTYSPLSVLVKADYFTSGVMLLVSFDNVDSDGNERAVDVTVDGLKKEDLLPDAEPEKKSAKIRVSFEAGGKKIEKSLDLDEGVRVSVGRTKENGLRIDDQSISKVHASLLLNKEGKVLVADTGSTNGTFVDGQRIAYGKAVELVSDSALMFGLIKVAVKFATPEPIAAKTDVLPAAAESRKVGDREFSSREPIESASRIAGGDSVSAISKPAVADLFASEKPRNEFATNVAPQPAPTEASVKVPSNGAEKRS